VTARPHRRARRAFWTLLALSILLVGGLSRALQAPPSPRTVLAVAVLGTLTVAAIGLAARLLLALTGRLRPHSGPAASGAVKNRRPHGRASGPDRPGP
jgi:hypothetical protein